METEQQGRISTGAPAGDVAQDSLAEMRELLSAIGGLNRQDFVQWGRELRLRRRVGKRPAMVDLVDMETGEVLDELPAEDVLRMMDELEIEREEEL
jgi:uncharacterized FlaG/YvyC family protein